MTRLVSPATAGRQSQKHAMRIVRHLIAAAVTGLIWLASAGSAHATDYYVDSSCAHDGNGQDGCALSAGDAGGVFRPPKRLPLARPGATRFIKNRARAPA